MAYFSVFIFFEEHLMKSFSFYNLFISAFVLLASFCLQAQNNGSKNDSTKVYKKAYDYSKKSKFSKLVYELIFDEKAIKNSALDSKKRNKPSIQHEAFDGKIIRKIHIESYDPFGYSVTDSLKKPKKKIERIGNASHIKTKKFTLKNLLLFKENEIYDSLKIKESERLIRNQRYTRRVLIKVLPTNANDSIDILLKVLDSWSLLPNGSLSTNQGSIKLTERNLLGLGHQISGVYKYRFDNHEKTISSRYSINNIKNSFINIELGYDNDFNNNSRRTIGFRRDFYSPLTKWAFGAVFENRAQKYSFNHVFRDSVVIRDTQSEYKDYWLGRSFKLLNDNSFKSRTTRFITSATFNKRLYKRAPENEIDNADYFSKEKNIIGLIGISSRQYYQDKFVFNYDIIEDIPYGRTFALTFGNQEKFGINRFYLGSKIAYGKKYSFGYLSGSTEYGTFFNSGKSEQSAFRFELNYFTNLIPLGKWKMRQFIKPSYIWGNNRLNSEKDLLTLNETIGIQGFNSPITGTQKWLLNLQTQTYTPGSWNGFRFSPYFNATFGSLLNSETSLLKTKIYSKFSVGFLINNDYLVFNSFQISFSYYPSIPFDGNNIIKSNSFENSDLSISDFQVSKPYYIRYE